VKDLQLVEVSVDADGQGYILCLHTLDKPKVAPHLNQIVSARGKFSTKIRDLIRTLPAFTSIIRDEESRTATFHGEIRMGKIYLIREVNRILKPTSQRTRIFQTPSFAPNQAPG
jgi:hypothetical protein